MYTSSMVKVGDASSAHATVGQHSRNALFQCQCTPGGCLAPLIEQQVGMTSDNLCLSHLFYIGIVEEIPLTAQRILTDGCHKETVVTIKDDDHEDEEGKCSLFDLITKDNINLWKTYKMSEGITIIILETVPQCYPTFLTSRATKALIMKLQAAPVYTEVPTKS